MLARSRILVLGLLAAGVAVGWATTLRGDDGAPGQAAAAASATTAGATTTTRPPATIGSLRDRLERLPPIAPGELHGVVELGGDGCSREQLDLGTLVRTSTPRDVCAAPGARYGVRLRDLRRRLGTVGIIDTDGHLLENVAVPRGFDAWGLTVDGIVFCEGDDRGRLRLFGGRTRPLSACPLTTSASGRLLFADATRHRIVDIAGRRVVPLRRRLGRFASVRSFGDGLIVVDADLYRGGRLIATLDLTDGVVLAASRDGDVALVSDAARTHLAVMNRDGTRRAIDPKLASRGGLLSPDGRHLLLQHDSTLLLELDAATLRPVARFDVDSPTELLDWLPAARP